MDLVRRRGMAETPGRRSAVSRWRRRDPRHRRRGEPLLGRRQLAIRPAALDVVGRAALDRGRRSEEAVRRNLGERPRRGNEHDCGAHVVR